MHKGKETLESSYLSKVSAALAGRAKTNLLLVLWVKKGDRRTVKA
jgi:hypothetical protein